MNILYDNIIFDLQRSGGISVYWSELIKLYLRDEENIIFFLERDGGGSRNICRQKLNLPCSGILKYKSLLPVALERYLPVDKQLSCDVFHSSYYRYPSHRLHKGVNIVTAHDFIYERCVRGWRRSLHTRQKYQALARADGIICISESTKSDLLSLYPELGRKPLEVIYNGVSKAFRQLQQDVSPLLRMKYHINFPYILYVGARTASYKNFDLVIEVLRSNPSYNLVMVGGGDLQRKERRTLNHTLKERYHHLQYISDTDLNMLYNAAHCLLYSSSYEGFGLPLLEAQQAGCPVIAFYNSSMPEVVASPASLISKPEVSRVNREIRTLELWSYREHVIKPGLLKSQYFSWEKCHEETLSFYNQVLSDVAEPLSLNLTSAGSHV
ncbi:glycosyltransferase family 4 protein [Flavihumibacter sp. R14]|nr:glycosyltransferase family 4 protein [Flavihumibacter soli]